jgi:thioredoxin reductase (NADPH)
MADERTLVSSHGPDRVERVAIIGSGPAGWTAAIYAARANLEPLVLEGSFTEDNRLKGTLPLGQLNLTTEVENFPGFPDGIMGPDLMLKMRDQAARFGARVLTEDVVSVDLKQRPFTLSAVDGMGTQRLIRAHAVIIATGASANYLGLESEQKYKNHGVSACAVCDGGLPRFRNKPLIVVGGGDTAAEEGHYLTKFAATVYLVHRRDRMRASPVMADRILSSPKVTPVWNSVVDEVLGNDEVGMTAARVKHLQTGETQTIEAAGMFVAIGHTPNTKFLAGQVKLDEKGFIVLPEPFTSKTSVEGVFAAGDVADPHYRQAITAAGMGCKAALDAERWLAAKGIH